MKHFRLLVLYCCITFTSQVQSQIYVGAGIGIANYNGEVGYNDYLVYSPISLFSRPGVEFIVGNRNRKDFRIELSGSYNSFSGSNSHSTVQSLKKIDDVKLDGHNIRFGLVVLSPELKNDFFIGGGVHLYSSVYQSNFSIIPSGQQNSTGGILEFTLGKRLRRGYFKDLLELRYSILISTNDHFDGVSLGTWNDHFVKMALCYTIPTRYIKHKYNSSRLLRKSNRHKLQCPSF